MLTYTFDQFTEQFTEPECYAILHKLELCGYVAAANNVTGWKAKDYWNHVNSENRSVIGFCVPTLPNEEVYIEDNLAKTFWLRFWLGWRKHERQHLIAKQN